MALFVLFFNLPHLIFLIIGIIGYFTVPNVTNYIIHAGGGNGLLQKVNSLVSSTSHTAASAVRSGSSMVADAFGNQKTSLSGSVADAAVANPYFRDSKAGTTSHMASKIDPL